MAKTILTAFQKAILSFLSRDEIFTDNFYLSGGTALAEYYLRHRISEDLDFFSEKEVDSLWLMALTKKLKKQLQIGKIDFQTSFNRNLVFLRRTNEVSKTEFTYYPFKQIEIAKLFNNIRVDSLIDIAVNKFFTIYQKPSARHFIDLYLMIAHNKIEWDKLSGYARIKFDTNIDPLQLGSQLLTATDVSDLPKMLLPLEDRKWRDFFYKKAMELKSKIVK